MENVKIYSLHRQEFETFECDVLENDVKELKYAFENGNKNVLFTSMSDEYNAACAVKYIRSSYFPFSKVIYARFDRASYLCSDSSNPISIDTVLKDAVCRPFIFEDVVNNNVCAKNYLLQFEKEADQNTLLIVDGFDAGAPSPYMRHLFCLDVSVLVLSSSKINRENFDLSVVSCVKQKDFCFDTLDESGRELLLSLCAVTRYIDDGVQVVSSKFGVFDEDSVRFYFGGLYEKLDELIKSGFVKKGKNGRIAVNRDVRKVLLSEFFPDSKDCKTFIEFADGVCSFHMLQDIKDIYAKLYAYEGDYNSFVSSGEFLCTYLASVNTENISGRNLYNILFSYIMENSYGSSGARFCRHLLFENAGYCISLLREKLKNEETMQEIYNEELYAESSLPDIYTLEIRAELDLIRLCVFFMRNITPDMYKKSFSIFEELKLSFEHILSYVDGCNNGTEMKQALLDDVIRLCGETFSLFCVIDEDGTYNYFRDSFEERRIYYLCEKETDELFGDSLVFGYSTQTVKLYSLYASFLDRWLKDSDEFDESESRILKQLHDEKITVRRKLLDTIKAHYVREIYGYEHFTDIYDSHKNNPDILSCVFDEKLEKRIEDNKRFLRRGFDGGTKKGALRFTCEVVDVISKSKNPLRNALTVLSPRYPLSDESHLLFLQNGFCEKLFNNENMTNYDLQILLETLVLNYSECLKSSRKTLYEEIMSFLVNQVNFTEAFRRRLYHTVSIMYVDVMTKILLGECGEKSSDYPKTLYKTFCKDVAFEEKYCDDYIANALYAKENNMPYDVNLVKNAIKIRSLERQSCDKNVLLTIF